MQLPNNWSIFRISAAVIGLFVLASCSPAGAPETAGEPAPAGAQEQAAEESAPAAAMELQAESRLKEPAAAAPQIFMPEQANPFPPRDIIQAVGYFGGAEPGYCSFMSVDLKPGEIEACPSESIEQMSFLALLAVGLENREPIRLTTTYPDGHLITQTLTADTGGMLRYEFIPDLEDQLGDYRFSFHTSRGELEKTIGVTSPKNAQLYLLPEQSQLLLVNFEPGEKVRIFLYRQDPDLGLVMRAWREYQVDAQGRLVLDYPPMDEPYFYAVGEASGLVPYREKGASSLRQMWPGGDIACPGAPEPLPLRFDSTISVTAQRVVAEIESYPQVFSFPIPRGTKLILEEFWGSPRCRERMIWWAVECPRLPGLDCQGHTRVWIPEGRVPNNYYVQPTQP